VSGKLLGCAADRLTAVLCKTLPEIGLLQDSGYSIARANYRGLLDQNQSATTRSFDSGT